MEWVTETRYIARIGGIIYENVIKPILLDDKSLLALSRNKESKLLGVSLELKEEDHKPIASIINNEIKLHNESDFKVIEGTNRYSIVNINDGRVWLDLKYGILGEYYELELSCILFPIPGYPIILHPDRTKFGESNNGSSPNLAKLTMEGKEEKFMYGAIEINLTSLYLLNIRIKNFERGISVNSKQN